MRSTRTALAALTVATLLLNGCGTDDSGADEPSSPSSSASTPSGDASSGTGDEKPRPEGPFADITFQGDTASPNGERIDLGVGEELTLRIDSDRAGELHVHSTPEQQIEFPAGQSEEKLVIDQPGVVDVEDHESGMVLLQLEVR